MVLLVGKSRGYWLSSGAWFAASRGVHLGWYPGNTFGFKLHRLSRCAISPTRGGLKPDSQPGSRDTRHSSGCEPPQRFGLGQLIYEAMACVSAELARTGAGMMPCRRAE